MKDLLLHLERQSKRSVLIKAYLTVAALTALDYVRGERLSLFIVYFFPTLIVAWYAGRRAGIVIASVCAAAVFLQDLSTVRTFAIRDPADLIPSWDFLRRLILFVTFSLTVSALRRWQDDKVEQQYRGAREVQSFMLPRTLPPIRTLVYSGTFEPATTLPGDFYDCLPVAPGRPGLAIGGVCGKGTPAALLMAHLHGVLRSHAALGADDPVTLVATTNRSLYSSSGSDRFASLFYGLYDDATRTLTYVNAGHDAPIVLRTGGEGGPAHRKPPDAPAAAAGRARGRGHPGDRLVHRGGTALRRHPARRRQGALSAGTGRREVPRAARSLLLTGPLATLGGQGGPPPTQTSNSTPANPWTRSC